MTVYAVTSAAAVTSYKCNHVLAGAKLVSWVNWSMEARADTCRSLRDIAAILQTVCTQYAEEWQLQSACASGAEQVNGENRVHGGHAWGLE